MYFFAQAIFSCGAFETSALKKGLLPYYLLKTREGSLGGYY